MIRQLKGILLTAILGVIAATPTFAQEDRSFTIQGDLVNDKPYSVLYINYKNPAGISVRDSIVVGDGKFSYSGHVKEPQEVNAFFSTGKPNRPIAFTDVLTFFLEPGIVRIEGKTSELRNVNVFGPKTQQESNAFKRSAEKEVSDLFRLNDEYMAKGEAIKTLKTQKESEIQMNNMLKEMEELHEQMAPVQRAYMEKQLAFIRANPDSYVSATQLASLASGLDAALVISLYDGLSERIKNSDIGVGIGKAIERRQAVAASQPAPDFVDTDINGQQIKLSDYRGKYVLLDFWASWCVPCRKGHPHLKSLYSKYQSKGFEIIGIASDDGNEDKWKKAIADDQISEWKHVLLRGERRENSAETPGKDKGRLYNVQGYPTKFLIDPSGVIIGRYGGGGKPESEIDIKLKEIFGE